MGGASLAGGAGAYKSALSAGVHGSNPSARPSAEVNDDGVVISGSFADAINAWRSGSGSGLHPRLHGHGERPQTERIGQLKDGILGELKSRPEVLVSRPLTDGSYLCSAPCRRSTSPEKSS